MMDAKDAKRQTTTDSKVKAIKKYHKKVLILMPTAYKKKLATLPSSVQQRVLKTLVRNYSHGKIKSRSDFRSYPLSTISKDKAFGMWKRKEITFEDIAAQALPRKAKWNQRNRRHARRATKKKLSRKHAKEKRKFSKAKVLPVTNILESANKNWYERSWDEIPDHVKIK